MNRAIGPCQPEIPVVIYRCTKCGYEEHSLTHLLGRLIDWIRDRENPAGCPKCGGEMKTVSQPPARKPWDI